MYWNTFLAAKPIKSFCAFCQGIPNSLLASLIEICPLCGPVDRALFEFAKAGGNCFGYDL